MELTHFVFEVEDNVAIVLLDRAGRGEWFAMTRFIGAVPNHFRAWRRNRGRGGKQSTPAATTDRAKQHHSIGHGESHGWRRARRTNEVTTN